MVIVDGHIGQCEKDILAVRTERTQHSAYLVPIPLAQLHLTAKHLVLEEKVHQQVAPLPASGRHFHVRQIDWPIHKQQTNLCPTSNLRLSLTQGSIPSEYRPVAPSISGGTYARRTSNSLDPMGSGSGTGGSGSGGGGGGSTRLTRLTPYILCAASRLIGQKQMAPESAPAMGPKGGGGGERRRVPPLGEQQVRGQPGPPRPDSREEVPSTEQEIANLLRHLLQRQDFEDNCNRRIHEWRILSVLIDKVLFWIFMLTTVATSVIFLLIIPIQRRGLNL